MQSEESQVHRGSIEVLVFNLRSYLAQSEEGCTHASFNNPERQFLISNPPLPRRQYWRGEIGSRDKVPRESRAMSRSSLISGSYFLVAAFEDASYDVCVLVRT